MRKIGVLVVLMVGLAFALAGMGEEPAKPADWNFNATLIEACSCPMFCQCFFNSAPASHGHGEHGGDHYCKFNIAYHVNKGAYNGVKLDGAEFWVSGDLGDSFADGKMDWAVLTFDPEVTPEQREGVATILGHVYPVEWGSFTVAEDAPMEWKASKDHAEARAGGGKIGEVVLNRTKAGMSDDPTVIKNLKYWGVPRNDGFLLMPAEVQAYRTGDEQFETKGTNGFMITLDMGSKDLN